jgi:signal transduction histidine kinase
MGNWSENVLRGEVIVRPTFFQTTWFLLICLFSITGILYALYQYRIHQLKKLQSIRNRISHDLHDDIGSTLGSISIYSEVAKTALSENRADVLEKIGEASREMLEKLNDIVWSINPENDTFEKLEAMGIRFEMTFTPEQHSRALNMDKRRNLFLIFKEALHNAAKYAECRQINIVLAEQNGLLRMEIRDDGKGFDPLSARGYNGNGLDSMKERAKAMGANLIIESKPGSGTRIHLWQK